MINWNTGRELGKPDSMPSRDLEIRAFFHGMNLAFQRNSMQKYLSVRIRKAGVVHINCENGHLFWEEDNLDSVSMQYVKKYLVQEGFVELALGALDPQPAYDADLFLDEISNPI